MIVSYWRTLSIVALLLVPVVAQAAVTVTLSKPYAQLVLGKTLQFKATVGGSTNTGVVWLVNDAHGGTAASGTITAKGFYTAPAKLPNPAIATITAVAKADRSVRATATITLLTHGEGGKVYYVAPNGSDTAAGSLSAPWKTIQHAATVAVAGDTVRVRQGVYNEHVAFRTSGNTAQGYITFENYPGETATVDGTGLTIPNQQFGLFTFANVSYVVAEGFEVRNYTTASIDEVPIGIFVTGAGSSVQLIDNKVHDITTTAATTPNACASNAFGITIYGTQTAAAIDGLAISGNEVSHLKTGCSETLSVDGNVTNFAIVDNSVHDDDNIAIGAIGFEKVAKDPSVDQARMGEIRGNTIFNITSFGNPDYGNQYAADGIYVDGGTDIVIEQNLIHAVDLGIEIASEHLGRTSSFVTARNNVIYGGNSAGISIGGYAAGKGGTDHATIVNNTLYGNDTKKTGSGEFQIQFNATNNLFENNILYAAAQSLLVNDFTTSTPDPATLDFNLYFAPAGAKAHWNWQNHVYTGFAAYRTGSGQDVHSPAFADPDFISLTAPNLDVTAASPARGAGVLLDSSVLGTTDVSGNPRVKNGLVTLGAYEP
ncbi:MAG TPA: right-handed parallel beta-helix repeat-containing protein [Rhizomicrobium sp.]|jgi:hypothetical protein